MNTNRRNTRKVLRKEIREGMKTICTLIIFISLIYIIGIVGSVDMGTISMKEFGSHIKIASIIAGIPASILYIMDRRYNNG